MFEECIFLTELCSIYVQLLVIRQLSQKFLQKVCFSIYLLLNKCFSYKQSLSDDV
jgi:hypothetical protein